jgi:hypothetical protein
MPRATCAPHPLRGPVLPWLVRLARQIENAKLRGREPRARRWDCVDRAANRGSRVARGSHWVDDEQRSLHAFAQLHSRRPVAAHDAAVRAACLTPTSRGSPAFPCRAS